MKYQLAEIFDIDELKNLCESFTELTGAVTTILDLEGNIHVTTGWQAIYTQFHRINNETKKLCIESDTILAGQIQKGQKYNIYKCKIGLTDVAMPIIVDDKHIGNLFIGQFLTEKPDIDFFKKQAQTYKFNEQKYLEALDKVRIFSEEQIKKTIAFLVQLTETIGNKGIQNLKNIAIAKQTEIDKENINNANSEYEALNEQLLFAKENAEENENHFRRIIETVPVMLYDYILFPDGSNKFLFVSSNCQDILELRQEELLADANVFWKMVHKDDLQRLRNEDVAANKKDDFFHSQVRITTKSGILKWIEVSSRPNPPKKNELAIWSGYMKDITERKKNEQALKKSEEKYRILSDDSIIPIVIHNLKGEIKYGNKALVKLIKAKNLSEIFKTPIINFVHPNYIEEVTIGIKKLLEGKDSFRSEQQFIRFDNEYIDVDVLGKLISYNNEKAIQLTLNDITDRKKAEEEIHKQNKQLKELNDTKDKFFSIIAHDLKSPFNAILGFSKILLNKHKEYDDEKREKIIELVNNSANSTFKLLENLLTWSYSQSGAIKYFPEKLHLKILLFETMLELQGQAAKKNIQISDKVSENELIFADKNMIATVLRNLISNAIKFTNNGGTIDIESEKQQGNNFLEISVTDTGVGIPKDKIDNLFRIDKNTSTVGTEKETGTGLGLILCEEFVEKHGGEIWMESELGKGSVFSFTIPYK